MASYVALSFAFFHGLTLGSFTSCSFYGLLAHCFAGCFLRVKGGGDKIKPRLPEVSRGGGMQHKSLLSETAGELVLVVVDTED